MASDNEHILQYKIPLFNRPRYLGKAIKSVLGQTYSENK